MTLIIFMLILSVLTNTIAQLSLKHAIDQFRYRGRRTDNVWNFLHGALAIPQFWAWGFLMSASLILWLKVLSSADLSFAYPFLSLSIVFIALGSVLTLKEQVTPRQWFAMALILLGIFLVAQT